MEEIILSIWCITYNHEKYIADAIEGCLKQKTNFKFEIIVHDDASTDNTCNVLNNYIEKYPEVIIPFFRKKNQHFGKKQNTKKIYRELLERSRGKYIAICEGDDYWIDKHKLQIQVDILENDSKCMLTGHNYITFNINEETVVAPSPYNQDCYVSINDIIQRKSMPIQASTFVCRREMFDVPDIYNLSPVGDYALLLHAGGTGRVYYIDRIMSVYRYLSESSYSNRISRDNLYRMDWGLRTLEFLKAYNNYTKQKYFEDITSRAENVVNATLLGLVESENKRIDNIITDFNEVSKGKYGKLLEYFICCYKSLNDVSYICEETEAFCNAHRELYVWGTGEYARIMSTQLTNNGISFKGFVVSDSHYTSAEFLGKTVIKSSDLLSLRNFLGGIIVSVNKKHMKEISPWLIQNFPYDYIYPFDRKNYLERWMKE